MDTSIIATAIIAAVSAGAATGATEVGKNAIVDAYNGIKSCIVKKFGKKSDIADAVEKLEAKPDSESRKGTVIEEVKSAKADQDSELLELAKSLIDALKNSPEGGKIIGKYQIDAKGAQIGVVGDNANISGGINFGK